MMRYGQQDARGITNAREGSALAVYRQAKAELREHGRLVSAADRDRSPRRESDRERFYRESAGIGQSAPWDMSRE